jgi:pilus assembly protein CpaB
VRSKTIMMIVMALVFGAAAVFAGQRWLDRQSSRLRDMQVVAKPVSTQKVVVAAIPFAFGTEITREHLREIDWPQGAVPRGAFGSMDEILDGKTRRVALSGIEENEPILKTKLTGPGQRASLAAIIQDGMKAVTVRVNDVAGVAGFVLPGERVDILLTRSLEREDAYADVLLQNVKVLAIDQSADDRSDKPSIVKAVTLEVNTGQAQKLTLAGTVGTLSLALRAAGAAEVEPTRRVAIDDLARPAAAPAALPNAAFVSMKAPDTQRTIAVGVTRALKRQEYSVPAQPAGLEAASGAKRPDLPKTATIASP